jgi:hypothetical protein
MHGDVITNDKDKMLSFLGFLFRSPKKYK